LPAEPWAKVETVDLLYLVDRFGEKLNKHLKEIIDNFDHPMRLKLISNGTGLTLDQIRASLKELTELKNLEIIRLPQKLMPILAFRQAAKKSTAKFLFLVTSCLQAVKAPRRLFSSLDLMKREPDLKSLRWAVEGEEKEKTVFECLIYRDYFLSQTKPTGKSGITVPSVTVAPPKGFQFDLMYGEFQKLVKEKKQVQAKELIDRILSQKTGFPHIQYLITDLFPLCLALGDYERAEKELLALIDRGYDADNYIRLNRLRMAQKRWAEAVEAGELAMKCLGLKPSDFEADCFPFKLGAELNTFKLFLDMGACHLELKSFGEAARCFHMASKLKSDSYKPFLGFAKTYLAADQIERAEETIKRMPKQNGLKDPETHRVLSAMCRKRKHLPLSFDCLKRAFEVGPDDEKNVEPFYFAGAGLGRWREMVDPLKTFVLHRENHAGALARLSSVHFNLGEEFLARETAERALALEPRNPVAKSILDRLNAADEQKKRANNAAFVSQGSDGLTLDIPDLAGNLFDDSPIVW
jgi:tetratricopeptide (TPR) repeat protein